MNNVNIILGFPYAKHVLAFEAILLTDLYYFPYKDVACYFNRGLQGYVDWASDMLLRILIEQNAEIEDALLILASHVGEDDLGYFEMKHDLRSFCSMLNIIPPTGLEAKKLYILGILEDLVSGLIPESALEVTIQYVTSILWSEYKGGKIGNEEITALIALGMEYHFFEYAEKGAQKRLRDLKYKYHVRAKRIVKTMRAIFIPEGEKWKLVVVPKCNINKIHHTE